MGTDTMSEQNLEKDRQMAVWLEEYRSITEGSRLRVELQQRSLSLSLVALSAFAGYLINYWNNHSLAAVEEAPIATLIVLAPLVGLVFLWRILDHDINIIDSAVYVETRVRPNLVRCVGDENVLSWERFLRARRAARAQEVGPVILFGNDHMILSGYMALFFACGWYLRIDVHNHAGQARKLFDILLYTGTGLLAISALMFILTALRYQKIAPRERSRVVRS
jgi:hypothetical protein